MNETLTAPDDFATLYRRAFKEYGTQALWNMRPLENPTPADALAITKALRTHGGMEGRRLAERIEKLCRPSLSCNRMCCAYWQLGAAPIATLRVAPRLT